jgi:hypothetical protein
VRLCDVSVTGSGCHGLEFRFELGWDQLLCEMDVQIDWSLGIGWNGIEMHGARRFIVINHVALLGKMKSGRY